jgi:transcriptional regulator with XRE-family HTH domain
MDWKQLLTDLAATGMTQQQIADRCGVAQSTISDLRRGATNRPSYELGAKLVSLRAEAAPQEIRDAA